MNLSSLIKISVVDGSLYSCEGYTPIFRDDNTVVI